MKVREKAEARKLRKEGYPLSKIANVLGVAKSTVSIWTQDIELTQEQKNAIRPNNLQQASEVRKMRTAERHARYIKEADLLWDSLVHDFSFLVGLSLYWGEGAKTGPNPGVANCDPSLLLKTKDFFELISPEKQIRAKVQVHDDALALDAITYWSSVLSIPVEFFNKPIVAVSKASSSKKVNYQKYGTCTLYICSKEHAIKILRWIELLKGC